MVSSEACGAISDGNGNLLFYTNGVNVYNKNHQLMLNGDNIGGNISTSQLSIVPKPGDLNIYYIFVADAFENDFLNGYKYAIVDMRDDFGNGGVISKNNLLWASCSERMTTIRHANGTDIWLVTNDNSSSIFRSWLISCTGLQPDPVISNEGDPMDINPMQNVGVLKGSPDGTLLCQTHFPFFDAASSTPNFVQLLSFDNTTGIISDPKKISYISTKYNHAEFSPDSKLLYLTRKSEKMLDQIEVTLPTLADILASRISIPTTTSYYDLEMAPDEKIYLTQGNDYLASIDNPNIKGLGCNFTRNTVSTNPGSAVIGLPSHINDMVSDNNQTNGINYTILDSCAGIVKFTGATVLQGTISWLWDFGDSYTSTQQNPTHTFANPKQAYQVILTVSAPGACAPIKKTRMITPAGNLDFNPVFNSIYRCDSNYVRFINTSSHQSTPGVQFYWDFGDNTGSTSLNPIHTYANAGYYSVKLKMTNGTICLDDSVSHDVEVQDFQINTIADQTIQIGQSVTLTTTGSDGNFKWTPGKWLSDSTIKSPIATPLADIKYLIKASNDLGCFSIDSVTIHVIPKSVDPDTTGLKGLYIPTGFTPNGDGRNDLFKIFMPSNYQLRELAIYNRWGQKVFSTKDPTIGWDGKTNGSTTQSDIYIWIVTVLDENGNLISRKGSLALIK